MTLFELILAVVVIVAATVAAILNHLTPELAALLGVAIGYVAKGAVVSAVSGIGLPRSIGNASPPETFKGAPPE
jgi:hypothetical protein